MSSGFADFRERLKHIIEDENLRRLHSLKKLRHCQLIFALDSKRHFATSDTGFAQLFTGSGKTGCAAMVCLGLLLSGGRMTSQCNKKMLIVAPTVTARQNLLEVLKPSTCNVHQSFLTRHLEVPEMETLELASHVFCFEDSSTVTLDKAWIVISTPHKLMPHVAMGTLQLRDYFNELIVDEGDVGTCAPKHHQEATQLSWHRLRSELTGRAKVLLLSATHRRSDGQPLPLPYTQYGYRQALEEGVAKRLRVLYLVSQQQQQTATQILQNQLCFLLPKALEKFIEQRKNTGIPWLMHIIVPATKKKQAPHTKQFYEKLLEHLQRMKLRCPITNELLSCSYAFSGCSQVRNRSAIGRFANFRCDILVSCKMLGRAINIPMIGCTLNLRRFGSVEALLQATIGRSVRTIDNADLERRHSHFSLFASRLSTGQLTHTSIILEDHANNNLVHYRAFAEQSFISIDEEEEQLVFNPIFDVATLDDDSDEKLHHNTQMITIPEQEAAFLPELQHMSRSVESSSLAINETTLLQAHISILVTEYNAQAFCFKPTQLEGNFTPNIANIWTSLHASSEHYYLPTADLALIMYFLNHQQCGWVLFTSIYCWLRSNCSGFPESLWSELARIPHHGKRHFNIPGGERYCLNIKQDEKLGDHFLCMTRE